MSNQEQISKLAELAYNCHQIERHFKELPFFYNLKVIDRAVHHIEHARMYAGDLLRLAVLGADHRKEIFFDVAEHGGRFTGVLQDFETSMDMVKWAKRELRALLYISCDHPQYSPLGANLAEYNLYFNSMLQHLKAADQCLGLWIGEMLTEQPAPPPSNATEVFVASTPIDKLTTFAEKQREAMFNAIMADLGDSVLADFGEARNVFGCSVYAGFSALKVEQVLRKHLGLPPQSLNPSIPQSF